MCEDKLLRREVTKHIDSTTRMLGMMEKMNEQFTALAKQVLIIHERVLALEIRSEFTAIELKKLMDSR